MYFSKNVNVYINFQVRLSLYGLTIVPRHHSDCFAKLNDDPLLNAEKPH